MKRWRREREKREENRSHTQTPTCVFFCCCVSHSYVCFSPIPSPSFHQAHDTAQMHVYALPLDDTHVRNRETHWPQASSRQLAKRPTNLPFVLSIKKNGGN